MSSGVWNPAAQCVLAPADVQVSLLEMQKSQAFPSPTESGSTF